MSGALCTGVYVRFVFRFGEPKESHRVYCLVKFGFRCTDVKNSESAFFIGTCKKGSLPSAFFLK